MHMSMPPVSQCEPITLRDLYLARARIAPWIRRTPLVASPSLSVNGRTRVFLKLETAQDTGAFKLRGAATYESVRAGHPVEVEEAPSLADSLGGGIGLANRYTFELTRALVDDYVLVTESQIADAMRHLYRHERVIAEGGGAVSVAAVLASAVQALSGNVVCVVSGGNVDMGAFTQIVADQARR